MRAVPVEKAGVGSGGPERLPAGRRLDRDRPDGRDHGLAARRHAADARSRSCDGFERALLVGSVDRARRRDRRLPSLIRPHDRSHGAEPAAVGRHDGRHPRAVRDASPRTSGGGRSSSAALRVFSSGELRRRDDRGDRARGRGQRAACSTATSPRSATSGSRASTPPGRSSVSAFDRASDDLLAARRNGGGTEPVGNGLVLPASSARWKKAMMPNLWIQGITEAGEDRGDPQARRTAHARRPRPRRSRDPPWPGERRPDRRRPRRRRRGLGHDRRRAAPLGRRPARRPARRRRPRRDQQRADALAARGPRHGLAQRSAQKASIPAAIEMPRLRVRHATTPVTRRRRRESHARRARPRATA